MRRPIACAGVLLTSAVCFSQQPSPALPSPSANTQATPPITQSAAPDAPTLRVNTTVVLVPTLVQKSSGEVLYGLGANDFTVEDDGVRQQVHVDDDLDSQPVSLVVAIEKGRSGYMQFEKLAKLGPLLELFLGQGHGKAALLAFDSNCEMIEDFTGDSEQLSADLRHLQPGDGGAAILDAVSLSVKLLSQQPPDQRRVLLLISESRDHGSKNATAEELVQRIGTTNTLVLSLTYSPAKAEFLSDLKGNGGGGPNMNLRTPLLMAAAALHKNVPAELSAMSGGEYAPFTKSRGFEDRVAEVASHARNRYILSFRPSDETPGLHTLKVTLSQDYGAHVVARRNYWAQGGAAVGPAGGPGEH